MKLSEKKRVTAAIFAFGVSMMLSFNRQRVDRVKEAVAKTDAKRQSAISIADVFRAKVVDVAVDSLMMQLTGETAKIDAFIKMFYEFEILELVRTGLTGLERA